MADSALPAAGGLAAGVALIALFALSPPADSRAVTSTVVIASGSSVQSSPQHYVPEVVNVTIGVNNTVRWVNQDIVPHAVTSDSAYVDPLSGMFDSKAQVPFILPGKDFKFTFSAPGVYPYHMEPHPWMQGTVIVSSR